MNVNMDKKHGSNFIDLLKKVINGTDWMNWSTVVTSMAPEGFTWWLPNSMGWAHERPLRVAKVGSMGPHKDIGRHYICPLWPAPFEGFTRQLSKQSGPMQGHWEWPNVCSHMRSLAEIVHDQYGST